MNQHDRNQIIILLKILFAAVTICSMIVSAYYAYSNGEEFRALRDAGALPECVEGFIQGMEFALLAVGAAACYMFIDGWKPHERLRRTGYTAFLRRSRNRRFDFRNHELDRRINGLGWGFIPIL